MTSGISPAAATTGHCENMKIGELIRDLRKSRGWSQGRLAFELTRESGTKIGREYISRRWESGQVQPSAFWLGHLSAVFDVPLAVAPRGRTQSILDTALQQGASHSGRMRSNHIIGNNEAAGKQTRRHGAEELPTPLGQQHERPGSAVGQSASASTAFVEWVVGADSGKLAVEWIADELSQIATAFVHASPVPLLARLDDLRDRIAANLRSRPSPGHASDLLLLAGVAMELMAQVAENLGDPVSARGHVTAVEALAKHCGHSGLLAWTLGTKALICEWHGDPVAAISIAERALQVAPVGDSQVRLSSLVARCAARLGDRDRAQTAATAAVAAFEAAPARGDELVVLGGSLTFPEAKMNYYLGTTHRLLGNYTSSQVWSQRAVDAYTSGPIALRSYGDETLARADIALARLAEYEVDGAHEVLAPVLVLSADQRISPITKGLQHVERAAVEIGPAGAELAAQVGTFLGRALPT
jgi:transcriptional regulator with XRE-family HTH domain